MEALGGFSAIAAQRNPPDIYIPYVSPIHRDPWRIGSFIRVLNPMREPFGQTDNLILKHCLEGGTVSHIGFSVMYASWLLSKRALRSAIDGQCLLALHPGPAAPGTRDTQDVRQACGSHDSSGLVLS